MLVTISGIDFSGKSTQIRLLSEHLEREGRRTFVLWYRAGYSAALDTLRRTLRRIRPGALPAAGHNAQRERAFQRRFVQEAWARMAIADLAVQYATRIRWHLTAGEVVICDRFVWDSLIDLQLKFPHLAVSEWKQWQIAARAAPCPDLAILLAISDSEQQQRMTQKKEPFPDSPCTRGRRLAAYQDLAATGRFVVLDGAQPESHVHQQITQLLRKLGA